MLSGISSPFASDAGLSGLLIAVNDSGRTAGGSGLESAASESLGSGRLGSAGMLSRNFVSYGESESRYVQASKKSFLAANKMANQQEAILTSAMASVGALDDQDNYAARVLAGKKAARQMREAEQQAVAEDSRRNLDEIKQGVEERARESVAAAVAENSDSEARVEKRPQPAAQSDPAAPVSSSRAMQNFDAQTQNAAAEYAAAANKTALAPSIDLAI